MNTEAEKVPSRSLALVKAQKKYYEKNKEKLKIKQTIYNESYNKTKYQCDCGDVITNSSRHHHIRSKRHTDRMDKIKNNIDLGKNHDKQTVYCECGGKYNRRNRCNHFNTVKHKKFVQLKSQSE